VTTHPWRPDNREGHPMDTAETSIAQAPLPTEKTIKSRTNLAIQAWRFAAINIRMVKMIRKGHS
jgi:hypothetical protein